MKTFTKCKFRKLILILLLISGNSFFTVNVYANNIAGGYLFYQFLGNDQYQVILRTINECPGIISLTDTLTVSSSSCGYSQIYIMDTVGTMPPDIYYPPCLALINTCNGGTFPGLIEWEYRVIVTLPFHCPDWIFSVNDCCRIPGLTTIQNPSSQRFYIEAALNNVSQDNNSVSFSSLNIFYCAGQTNYLNLGTVEFDGDSLAFTMIDGYSGSNTPVTYNPGFSATSPVTSSPNISFNQQNGDLIMTPTDTTNVGIIAIQITEYRAGVPVGYTMTNLPAFILACWNNSGPTINTTEPFTITIEAGIQYCFDCYSFDGDVNDTVIMYWNNAIAGATFTVNGNYRPIGQFCWTPADSDTTLAPHSIVITVRDDACPSNNVASYQFQIFVTPFTGISEITKDDIRLFPNPSTGEIKIEFNHNLIAEKIFITAMQGNVVSRGNTDNPIIDLSKFESGIYFIDVDLKDGRRWHGKIVKQ